ncbi:MAG TPA: aminotransferase class I/II-fold pyridoxal phosphate-dependent enzyme [Bacteroidia bacterium]|jgi:cystathionine gamma-synthase|nr:aminotransferase class I/II-fold pyridoxal phosphate-dependent enzyme [Bacteroidia bacterium]
MINKHIQTIAVHAGEPNDKHSDVIQPIHLSSTFTRNTDGTTGEYIYTRANNPNRLAVEQKMAALEGAKTAITFSSGMAAINALFENILQPNCHLILPDDCYHGTRRLLDNFFKRWNVRYDMTDMSNLENIKQLIQPETRLIWMETPSNPKLKITDIAGVVALSKMQNIITVCDNTFATAIIQKCVDMDVDYIMYSSTKFFSGHSDILGGVIMTNHENELSNRIRDYQQSAGAVPSPFDCWLLNRSLSTFPLRFSVQCANAKAIADFLSTHKNIETVFYPGLPTHPNHDIAKKQMKNSFGSIVSILVKGDKAQAMKFASALSIFKHATSLGGVESLVEHRRSVEGDHPVSPDNLLRISVGIEFVDDLIADLNQALASL